MKWVVGEQRQNGTEIIGYMVTDDPVGMLERGQLLGLCPGAGRWTLAIWRDGEPPPDAEVRDLLTKPFYTDPEEYKVIGKKIRLAEMTAWVGRQRHLSSRRKRWAPTAAPIDRLSFRAAMIARNGWQQ